MKENHTSVTLTVCVLFLSALLGVIAPPPCNPANFQCESGLCIPLTERCDGVKQCPAGDDEKNCPVKCGRKIFLCTNGRYIDLERRCNGISDCDGNEDEMNCKIYGCNNNTFQCSNGQCITQNYICNGIQNCNLGEDEELCGGINKCVRTTFTCASGQCLPMSKKCDGRKDCGDGDDEWNCLCRPGSVKKKTTISCPSVTKLFTEMKNTISDLSNNTQNAESKCETLRNSVRVASSKLGQSWTNLNQSLSKLDYSLQQQLSSNTPTISNILDTIKNDANPSNKTIWDMRALIQKIIDAQKQQANKSDATWLTNGAKEVKYKFLLYLKTVPKQDTAANDAAVATMLKDLKTQVFRMVTTMLDRIMEKLETACNLKALT